MNSEIERYVRERASVGELAPSSVGVIRVVLRTFARHVHGIELADIRRPHVEAWLAPHVEQPNTHKSKLTKLRPFSRWLVEGELIDRDFTIGVRGPSIQKGPVRALAAERVSALVRACPDERALLIVLLMVGMGLRCVEVERIQMDDVLSDTQMLRVRGKGGRGRVTREVPIHIDVEHMTVRYLAGQHRLGGPLLRSYKRPECGLTAHTISALVGDWMAAAGLDESAHALRHTFAQELIDAGADWRLVQDGLGHASIATTMDVYGRRRPTGLRAAMNAQRYAA